MLLIGVRAGAVKEEDRKDGGQFVPVLFTAAPRLQPLAAKCTHPRLFVCVYA